MISLAAHLAGLVALLSAASGSLVTGSTGGAPMIAVMEVTMVQPPHRAEPPEATAAVASLQPLFAKFDRASEQPPVTVSKGGASSGFEGLVERLTQRDPSGLPPKPRPDHATRPLDDEPEETPARAGTVGRQNTPGPAATQAAKGATPAEVSSGPLWGRVEPCWRDLSANAHVAVILEVEFDRRGRLAKPPRILRPVSAPVTEDRLRAEGRALAALAACLPQADFPLAGTVQRLEFGG